METLRQLRAVAREQDNIWIAHREYDDGTVIAIDFGPGVAVSVDTVGETAIVVVGDHQFEFDVPVEATRITANEGVLLIED